MTHIPLYFQSATELGRQIKAKKISSVELTEIYLKRLQSEGTRLNALAELTVDLARKQAKRADVELAEGKIRSPLHGVPCGVKDLLATAGIPTRWGSPAHKDQIFDYDATVVTKLREAGAVLIGKLAMVELAGGGGYDSPGASITGAAKCPWNTAKWAGGSSSGSGAAVGAGAVGFAIGTETWGSITVPAAFCGVSGLRPTYGRVSRHGAMALSYTLDKIGPMARSAEDCGHILKAISGHDPQDPSSTERKFVFPSRRNGKPLRLGILPHDYANAPEARKLFDGVLELFRKAKHVFKEVDYPKDIPYGAAAGVIINAEGASAFYNLIKSQKLELLADPFQQAGFIATLSVPATDYLHALRTRKIAIAALSKMWDEVDLLIAPTLLQIALPADRGLSETWQNMGGNGGPGNLAGLPSISVPMGFGKEGCPLGLEIIGKPYDEASVLALAMQFQRETDWHQRHPA